MKTLLCIIAAMPLLLTGCLAEMVAQRNMNRMEVQRQQDLEARRQYLTAHPDLDISLKWDVEHGTQTLDQIESFRVRRAEFLHKQYTARKKYTTDHPALTEEFRHAIMMGDVVPGMSSEDVLASWQTDEWKLGGDTNFNGVKISEWKLGNTIVTFNGDIVFSVSHIRL